MLKTFGPSAAITIAALAIGAIMGGPAMLLAVAVLIILEISLSFDNAVVNAKILAKMSPLWQKLFLTVGILIAVFGMRLILPVVLVAVTANLGFGEVWNLALNDPEAYEGFLEAAKESIYAFGGIFLLMIFLNFILDPDREIYWLKPIEKPLVKIGKLDTLPVVIALATIYVGSRLTEPDKASTVFVAGIFGLMLYLAVSGLDGLLEEGMDLDDQPPGTPVTNMTFAAGLTSFLYLELIDASFSFDGVIGAFAISNNIIVIALGLGVGAFWVRSMTIYLVREGTLTEYVYLEHGAHWAIGALAFIMIAELQYEINEYFTGVAGVVVIILAVISSVIEKRRGEDTDPKPIVEIEEVA